MANFRQVLGKTILRRICQCALLFLTVTCSLALSSENLDEPWRRLIKTREYAGAIEILQDSAKSASSAEDIAELYYSIGDIHFKFTHEYDKALKAYQKVVGLAKRAKSPVTSDYIALSRMSIAAIYQRVGRNEDAIEVYTNMAADYSGTPYASVATANIKGIQDAQTEIQLQRQIIEKYPNSEFAAEAQFEIAELYLSIHNLNDPWQAIEEYARLVDQYPGSRRAAEAQLKIGEVYWRLNKPEKAIATYQRLIRKHLSTNRLEAEALFRIGRLYHNELHDYQRAMDAFSRFLNDHPTYWKFSAGVYWQGMCYEQLGNYEDAVSTFEMFVQLYPDEKPGWLADIEQFGRRNVKQRVQSRIEELKRMAPEAKWNTAERLRSRGEYHQALSAYRELMGRYPESQYAKKAETQIDEVENLAEIQICQDTVKRKDIEAPASQYRIAEIYETRMRDYPRALEEYEKVARNYQDSHWAADALYRMGLIYSDSGSLDFPAKDNKGTKERIKPDYNKAIQKFRQLSRKYPKTNIAAEAYYQMGEIYRTNLGDYKRALEAYSKVVNDYPRQNFYVGKGYKNSLADEAQFKIGKIYYEDLYNYDLAFDVFTKFLNDYPNSCRKAAAYSFIAAIHEQRKNGEAAAERLEQTIDLIVESDVQSAFFTRDALYDGGRNQEGGLGSLDLQRDIIMQLRRRVAQLRTRVARSD